MKKLFSDADRAFLGKLRTWLTGLLFGVFVGRATVVDGFAAGMRMFGIFLVIILVAHVIVSTTEERMAKQAEPAPTEKKDDDATPGH